MTTLTAYLDDPAFWLGALFGTLVTTVSFIVFICLPVPSEEP